MTNFKFSFIDARIFIFATVSLFVMVTTSNNEKPCREHEEKLMTSPLSKELLTTYENISNLDENQDCNPESDRNLLDRTFEEKLMEEFNKMELIFKEKFEKEEDKFYRMRASDISNDNRLDRLKEDLQRDIDRLKAQLLSQVEEDLFVLEEDDEEETFYTNNPDISSRMKRHDAKKIKKSTPCYSNLCSFPFRNQYGGLYKDTKVNNQPPTSCSDLGRMGYKMSGLYPVQKDGSSKKISIVHCEFNSPVNKENEYGHRTIGNQIDVDLSSCNEAAIVPRRQHKEGKSSGEPKTPQHQESEDQEPDQVEEDETKPQESVGKAAFKFLSSIFQG